MKPTGTVHMAWQSDGGSASAPVAQDGAAPSCFLTARQDHEKKQPPTAEADVMQLQAAS